MRRPRATKRQRDFAFAALVVLLLTLCFFYMMWVFSHITSIQAQQQASRQKSSSGGKDKERLYAEEEIEGGFDLSSWERMEEQKKERLREKQNTLAPLTPLVDTEQKATEAVVPQQESGQEPLSDIPSRNHINDPNENINENNSPVKKSDNNKAHPNVHAKPLTTAERLYETQLDPIDINGGDSHSIKLLEKYLKDTTEFEEVDSAFYRQNGHIFSHIPHAKRLFQLWVKLNQDMRSGKKPARYVVVHPVGQLCNRLMAIASGAMLAMVTKRGLVVDDNGFYCSMNDLFENPGFEWLSAVSEQGIGAAVDLTHASYVANPDSGVWEDTEKLLCESDYNAAYPQPHIDLSINQFIVPYLTRNPSLGPQLRSIFRGEDTLFYPLSHFLFRPIEKLVAMRDGFVRNHFSNARAVVGLQLRSGGDFTDHFMNAMDLQLYKDCAETIVTPNSEEDFSKPLIYFVATDTPQGREMALSHLRGPNTKVLFGPTDFLLSNHPEGVQMALLDLMLLAAADDRVTTAWSSYGYFAAGYSGARAAMVVDQVPESEWIATPGMEQRFMGIPHKSDKRVQCVRLSTFQPCFHKFESWGASKSTCYTQHMRDVEQLNGRYC